jgi:hypothetical protein
MANPFAFATVNHIPLAMGIPYVSLAQGDLVLLQFAERDVIRRKPEEKVCLAIKAVVLS